jgi:hypothetical protein
MVGAALDFGKASLSRVIASALCVGFAYLVIALYCVLVAGSYRAVIRLLLTLGLALTCKLLLLLINLLLQLDDACLDPRMLESLLGRHPLFDLPLEALINKVNEEIVIALHHLVEALGVGYANLAFRVRVLQWPVVVIEEHLSPRGHHDHGAGRDAFHLHYALDLLLLVLAGEDREADVQLVQNAAKRPHVDGRRVSDSHHDLWCSIEPALDVGVELVCLVRPTAKVDHLYTTLVRLPQENVLWLHVAMYDVVLFHVVERDEQLDREAANQAYGNALEIITLDELVEVHAQHLEDEDQVLAERELLLYANDVLLVLWVVVAELLQDLGFDEALLVEPLLVPEDLESHVLLVLVVEALEHLAEAAFAEPGHDFESVTNVLAFLGDVLVLVIVEAVVVDAVGRGRRALRCLPLIDVEPVDRVVVQDLLLFDLHQIL